MRWKGWHLGSKVSFACGMCTMTKKSKSDRMSTGTTPNLSQSPTCLTIAAKMVLAIFRILLSRSVIIGATLFISKLRWSSKMELELSPLTSSIKPSRPSTRMELLRLLSFDSRSWKTFIFCDLCTSALTSQSCSEKSVWADEIFILCWTLYDWPRLKT